MRTPPGLPNARARGGRRSVASFLLAAGTLLLSCALCAAALSTWGLVGCSSVSSAGFNEETDGGEAADATELDAATPSSPFGPTFGNDSGSQGALAVTPASALVNVVKPGLDATQTFKATVGGATASVAWSLDNPALGTIDGNGVFRS